jgi:DNA polymerase theta
MSRIGRKKTLDEVFEKIEMPVQYMLTKMEYMGFGVNVDKVGELMQKMTNALSKLKTEIDRLAGRRVNMESQSDIASAVGIQKDSRGKISTAKDVLEKIDSPIANFVRLYRKVASALSKLRPIAKCIVNNRLHSNSDSFTQTGRISMHEPNLQAIVKDFEVPLDSRVLKISCRSVFGPLEAKRYILSADFCQLELRILAHFSNDRALKNVFSRKNDVFKAIAADWNKIPENRVTEEQRNHSKQICYAIIYGMGVKSLAEQLDIEESEAEQMMTAFHRTYPGIKEYCEKIVSITKNLGYIETITGRRRFLPNIKSPNMAEQRQAERQAVNTTIQGSAADIAKSAIIRMNKNLCKHREQLQNEPVDLILHLHDELIYEVPKSQLRKAAKLLKVSMEKSVQLSVPLIVKVKAGRSWGELEEMHLD